MRWAALVLLFLWFTTWALGWRDDVGVLSGSVVSQVAAARGLAHAAGYFWGLLVALPLLLAEGLGLALTRYESPSRRGTFSSSKSTSSRVSPR